MLLEPRDGLRPADLLRVRARVRVRVSDGLRPADLLGVRARVRVRVGVRLG